MTPQCKEKLENRLQHRGPDEPGELFTRLFDALFWRLEILPGESGRQPHTTPDSSVTIMFNGEIYNHKELEFSLTGKRLNGRSECEVIALAYRNKGMDCFNYLDGMFSIVIVDQAAGEVICARDQFGVKPLYYCLSNDSTTVCSEQKGILEFRPETRSLNYDAFADYQLFQMVPGRECLNTNTFKVLPGEVVIFSLDTGKLKSRSQYGSSSMRQSPESIKEYRELVAESIQSAVSQTFDVAYPIAFHLSGGLDSNLLVGMYRRQFPDQRIRAVTSFMGDKDPEEDLIRECAKHHNIDLEIVRINPQNFFKGLEELSNVIDEPCGDAGIVPQYLVNKQAGSSAKVIFSGQGLDEMFCGYMRSYAAVIAQQFGVGSLRNLDSLSGTPFEPARDFFLGWERFLNDVPSSTNSSQNIEFCKLIRDRNLLKRISENTRWQKSLLEKLGEHRDNLNFHSNNLDEYILRAELTYQLPALLQMEDAASMSVSCETRVPFCANRVLQAAKSAKATWKVDGGLPKGIIRSSLKEYLPKQVLTRTKKVGRPTFFNEWFYEEPGESVRDLLTEYKEFLNFYYGKQDFRKQSNGDESFDRSLWGMVRMAMWLDKYSISI